MIEELKCFMCGTVLLELEETEKYSALRELIRKAPVFGCLPDRSVLETAVLEREKERSTGIGHGVAIAHGKIDGINSLYIALGISRKGIPFNSVDGRPVNLLFIVANPPEKQNEYLAALSSLVRMIRDRSFREDILRCFDQAEIEHKLCETFQAMLSRFCVSTAA